MRDAVIQARWLAPMSADGPDVIEGAAVRLRAGHVVAVGRALDVSTLDADVTDLGDALLLPGLINAHTHLELSNARPGPKPASFGEWILGVVRHQSAAAQAEDAIATAALAGARESLGFGVTTVGDISRSCAITRRALKQSPLNVISFGEVQAMARRRELLEERLATAIDPCDQTDRLTVALSPHAPYTVEPAGYRRCVQTAAARGLRLCTHLAESLDERAFLDSQTGPLRAVWDRLGTWDDHVPRWPAGPIDLAAAVGLLDYPALLAHVNYVSDNELDRLARGKASVVFCPRTHAYFGHSPHRWREMLARGINVCVGTDGRGSAPDLNVVDDLRLLRRSSPELGVKELWRLVTTHAAKALHLDDVGRVAAGMRANLVAFANLRADPLFEVLDQAIRPIATWVDGRQVVG